MSWAEARTRLAQERSKRVDLLLYRIGFELPGRPFFSPNGSNQKYFFARNIDELTHRASLLRQHLPQAVDDILQEADSICRHNFHLLGYEKLEFGSPIDWHKDPVHGKTSPQRPWYKIDYLNFDEVGDHKIIWELNRHQHLVTLAKAWRLTNDRRYTDEAIRQWYSWVEANPYPIGINWASSLEVAFRSLSWLWVRELLQECPDLPPAFLPDLWSAVQRHGRYIERYLSTYFSPNTHLIGEAVALFFLGVLCPEMPAAERWREKSWNILLKEVGRQVREDGLYFEQSLYYHVYALDFFLYARTLANKNGHVFPEQFDSAIKQMLHVLDALSEVGPPEGFGDDDGGRVFNPRRNRVEHMTDPLALGAAIYGKRYAASQLTEESIWLFGDIAIERLEGLEPARVAESRSFPAGGIYLINDLDPVPQQLTIDAGPQGITRSGHGHADALNVRMSVNSHRILIDPGTCCYISPTDNRDRFRGTGFHNTLRVDNLDQAIPEGPFAWSSIPNVKTDKWLTGNSFTYFSGRHDGYSRLPERVTHRRFIFHMRGGWWLIRDLAEGSGQHTLEVSWHLSPDIRVEAHKSGYLLTPANIAPEQSGKSSVVMFVDQQSNWKTELSESLESPAYGSARTAPMIRTSTTSGLLQDCATLLSTRISAPDLDTFTNISDRETNSARAYRYDAGTETDFIFFAPTDIPWTSGIWRSNAELLYCKIIGGQIAQIVVVGGSFAEYRGQKFVCKPLESDYFEWSMGAETADTSAELFLKDLTFADPVL